MIGVLFWNDRRFNCVRLYTFGEGTEAAGFVPADADPEDDPLDILVLADARIAVEAGALEIRGYQLLYHDGHALQESPAEGAHYSFQCVRFVPYTVLAHHPEMENFDGRAVTGAAV